VTGDGSLEHPIPEALGSKTTLPPGFCCGRCNNYVAILDHAVTAHTYLGSLIVFGQLKGKRGRERKRIWRGIEFHPAEHRFAVDAREGSVEFKEAEVEINAPEDTSFNLWKFSRGMHKMALALLALQTGQDMVLAPVLDRVRGYIRQPRGRDEFWPYIQRGYGKLTLSALRRLVVGSSYHFACVAQPELMLCYINLVVMEVVVSLRDPTSLLKVGASHLDSFPRRAGIDYLSARPWLIQLTATDSTNLPP
jgi:hypothetical protein